MSSHALALGLSVAAYATARRLSGNTRFAFGTWKIEVLAGFASAIFLLGIAALMVVTSVERFFVPQPIQYVQAIPIAVVGLIVNIVCALILGSAPHHSHDRFAARNQPSPTACLDLGEGVQYGYIPICPIGRRAVDTRFCN